MDETKVIFVEKNTNNLRANRKSPSTDGTSNLSTFPSGTYISGGWFCSFAPAPSREIVIITQQSINSNSTIKTRYGFEVVVCCGK